MIDEVFVWKKQKKNTWQTKSDLLFFLVPDICLPRCSKRARAIFQCAFALILVCRNMCLGFVRILMWFILVVYHIVQCVHTQRVPHLFMIESSMHFYLLRHTFGFPVFPKNLMISGHKKYYSTYKMYMIMIMIHRNYVDIHNWIMLHFLRTFEPN